MEIISILIICIIIMLIFVVLLQDNLKNMKLIKQIGEDKNLN